MDEEDTWQEGEVDGEEGRDSYESTLAPEINERWVRMERSVVKTSR